MRVLCLTHIAFEGPGRIAAWVDARGHQLNVMRTDLAGKYPDVEFTDMVVAMGGPMSVNDSHPWLREEMAYLEQVLRAKKPVLGVCLGAQLLARIFGARVYAAGAKEIGWWPTRSVSAEADSALPLPPIFHPLHWHGETFDLPSGAVRLAESNAIANQAFSMNRHVMGLQFHIEATPESVADIVAGAGTDIDGGNWQQPAEQIVRECPERCKALELACYAALDWLVAKASE